MRSGRRIRCRREARPVHLQAKPAAQSDCGTVFAGWPGIETASAGLNHDAEIPVTPELLTWAQIIFVMERAHRSKLSSRFRAHIGHARVVCLDIPDDYDYMDVELVRLLKVKVPKHLPRT